MFFLKQLGSLLDAVKEIDPDANPSVMIKFMLPNGTEAKVVYVHTSFDGEGDSQGSIVLYYGDNKTEFDSLQYALDGINNLCGSTDTNTSASNNVDTMSADKLADNLDTMSADELAGDLVTYLYDKYKGAAYIGEKELSNGAIALRFEWGSDFKDIEQDLAARYGDRITFIRTRSEYAPEQTASGVLVAPSKAAQAVTESIATDQFELVENFPIWAIEPLVNDSWGDYLQYNGEELAREDFSDIDNFMTTHGYCGIHAPSDELYDQTHSGFTSRPAFGKSTDTCSVYAIKGPWKSLMKEYGLETAAPVTSEDDSTLDTVDEDDVERSVANSIDTAMMDHYDMMNGDIGDFEAVEFYKDIKAVCDIAGKPALAEAVIKLHKAYRPVLEAVEKEHKVPRDIAVAFNDYIADTLYTRPETHDMLKEREFEPNWEWLDDNAGAVIKVWNETHDPSEIKRLLDNLDEDAACWFEGI